MSTFWSWYVAVLTVANIVGCYWLIKWATKTRSGEAAEGDVTGHTWDEDLQEFNNPLPRWWLWLFYITMVFGLIYIALYPGLGGYKGSYGWTQVSQYEAEMDKADKTFGPLFANFAKQDIPALAKDPQAIQIGQRLFINYCSTCHGSDAGGAPGFPNLADNDWLYGSNPEDIKNSILTGRSGVMPAMGAALGEQGVKEVTAYVMSLSGRNTDSALAAAGKTKYETMCAACHQANGTGNNLIGAPNLTDNIWLYGGSAGVIAKSIREGRNGIMPSHRDFLGEDKGHLLAAYIYSLRSK
jgi:cytochrome c oxidase cbb3-type subunit 3